MHTSSHFVTTTRRPLEVSYLRLTCIELGLTFNKHLDSDARLNLLVTESEGGEGALPRERLTIDEETAASGTVPIPAPTG